MKNITSYWIDQKFYWIADLAKKYMRFGSHLYTPAMFITDQGEQISQNLWEVDGIERM